MIMFLSSSVQLGWKGVLVFSTLAVQLSHAYTYMEYVSDPLRNHPNQDHETRIVGGENAAPYEFPYYVQLPGSCGGSCCGGSLIAPAVVLTAAHCSVDEGDEVIVGAYQRGQTTYGAVRAVVADVEPHPNYGDVTLDNDFMLLLLDSPVTTSSAASNINLELNNAFSVPYDGQDLTVIGLGLLGGNGNGATILQEVEVQAISTTECRVELGLGIGNDEFCFGVDEGDKSSCFGDSGGPVLDERGNTHIQVGVVSWGLDDCSGPFSGAARVSFAYEWIRQVLCVQWRHHLVAFGAYFCVPSHDSCYNPWDLEPWVIGSFIPGTTLGATLDNLPGCHSATAVNAPGVWYSIFGNGQKMTVTTCTGDAEFDGDFDSQIVVYRGFCDNLICVAGNNDDEYDECGSESRVTWESQNGELYRIHVFGRRIGETGSFSLVVRPGMERCEDAEGPVSFGMIMAGSTTGATERYISGCSVAPSGNSAAVWYWTRGTGKLMKATTCTGNPSFDGDFDSVISVWGGSCSNLRCVTGNDNEEDYDHICGTESTVTWESDDGQVYYIQVYGKDAQTGDFGFVVSDEDADDGDDDTSSDFSSCNSATELIIGGSAVAGSNVDGSEDDLSRCYDSPEPEGPGMWFKVVGDGHELTATTCTGYSSLDGDFDSIISVWEGPCFDLHCEAGNDDGEDGVDDFDCGTESMVHWSSRRGRSYYLYVHGLDGDEGLFGIVVRRRD